MAGYNGNPNLRAAEDEIQYTPEMQKEFIRCMEDIVYFAENYCHIVTIDEGKKLIKLWDFQKRMIKVMHDPPVYKGEKKRNSIFCTGRQIGKCLQNKTLIKIKNKKTGEIKEMEIGKFHEMIK